MLVDVGSVANALTWEAFFCLKISPEKLKIVTTALQSFGGTTVILEETIKLFVMLGTYPTNVGIMKNFLVVKTPMEYNAIYGQPLLNFVEAIPSTYHQVMEFSTS